MLLVDKIAQLIRIAGPTVGAGELAEWIMVEVEDHYGVK